MDDLLARVNAAGANLFEMLTGLMASLGEASVLAADWWASFWGCLPVGARVLLTLVGLAGLIALGRAAVRRRRAGRRVESALRRVGTALGLVLGAAMFLQDHPAAAIVTVLCLVGIVFVAFLGERLRGRR